MTGQALLRRLCLVPVTLFGVALVVFVLLRIIPGDPVALMAAPGATAADIQNLRASFGLDKPIPVQFVMWLNDVFHGDLGRSLSFRSDVVRVVLERMPPTLELVILALAIAIATGGLLALLGTYFRGGVVEWVVDGIIALFQATPDFLLALFLILLCTVMLPLLPNAGRIDPALPVAFSTQFYIFESLLRGRLDVLGGVFAHAILPAIALAVPFAAMIARVLKGSLGDAQAQDYTLMARTRGFRERRILLVESLPNALIPAVSLTGIQVTFLLAGTVLVERIFAYPGIGNLAVDAVAGRDLPLLQGIILAFAILFVLVNLATDVIVMALNPRLSHG
jgi:ABC-type dipeptide/oligopeptide/nickel transport system permease component